MVRVPEFEGGGAFRADSLDATIDPGEAESIALVFEGAPRAQISLVMDLSENVTARFGEVVLETVVEDSYSGVVILAADLVDPVDGDLVVDNQGSQKTSGAVYVVLDSPRKLSLVADPVNGDPGVPVEIVVTLTDASPEDQVEIEVTSQNEGMPKTILDLDSEGQATITYVPGFFGYFSVLAMVHGDRPRMAGAIFHVLPRFEEHESNPDG